MKLTLWILILALSGFCLSAEANPRLEKRELSLELESVEGAVSYQLEIRPVDRSANEKHYTFTSGKPKFKLNLRPGHFEMRLRAADERGTFGDWSEPSRLTVAPKPVERLKPEHGAKLFERDGREVEFSWAEAPGAQSYRVIVADSEGKTVAERDFEESRGEIALPPGGVYRWQVLSRFEGDLYSESEGESWELSFIGQALLEPSLVAQTLKGLRWKASPPAKAVDFEFADANVATAERLIQKTSGGINGALKYELEERVLYRVTLTSTHPLMDPSPPKTVYFERQNGELIVYGDVRPGESDRLASKGRRWFLIARRASYSFTGANVQYGQRTSFEGAGGFNIRGGAVTQGKNWDRRFDLGYSAFAVTSGTGDVIATMLQANFSFLWRSNLGFKKLPLRLAFGFGYDETPEFIANSSQVLALQYFRTVGWSLALESAYAFSRRRSLGFGFGLTFPVMELQAPGDLERGSRADLYLRYYHDFRKLTGILCLEIQGTNFEYGGGTVMDFSSGGFGIGVMY